MSLRRWFTIRFRTSHPPHPWGKPQARRPTWWGSGDFIVAADSYEEAEAQLTEWMDEAFAKSHLACE